MSMRFAIAASLVLIVGAWFSPVTAGGDLAKVLPIQNERIVLPAPIAFKTGTPEIHPDSHRLLASVAATLETHMDIALVEIGAHTDSRGSGAFNKKTSQQRADAVLAYLVGKGLPRDRLVAVGYGEERPIDSNRTEAGRSKNRRVELVIKKRCPAGLTFSDGTCKARGR